MTSPSHAVVVAESIAGLLAAHVLVRHVERVTLIERDRFPASGEPRKGAPQSWQLHGLLAGGRRALATCAGDLAARLACPHAARCARVVCAQPPYGRVMISRKCPLGSCQYTPRPPS